MKQGAINIMNAIGGFIARLSSRKFLLTIFGILAVTLYPEGATAIVTLIATFVGAEGVGDAVSRYASEQTKQATINSTTTTSSPDGSVIHADDDEPDVTGTIIPGDVPM